MSAVVLLEAAGSSVKNFVQISDQKESSKNLGIDSKILPTLLDSSTIISQDKHHMIGKIIKGNTISRNSPQFYK